MGKVNTTRFGEIEYKAEEVISFGHGIPGFETEHQFIIIEHDAKTPFAFLQSITMEELALVITDPFIFYQDYEFEIDEQTKDELELKDVNEVDVWNVLSIPNEFKKTTINLKAPIIINIEKKKGKQIILKEDYLIKTPLFTEEGGE